MENLKSDIPIYKNSTILANKYSDILYYPEIKTMHLVWKQPATSSQYRQTFLKTLEMVKTYPTIGFISDITRQGLIAPEDRTWFEECVLPDTIESGIKKIAVVFDRNIIKKYYLNFLMNSFKRNDIPMKLFTTMEKATHWIIS